MQNNNTEKEQAQTLNEIRNLLQTQVFGKHNTSSFNSYSQAVFNRLNKCHTAAIGVHHLKCDGSNCGHASEQYHSCHDRHCPNCGGQKRAQWLQDRMSELLPTTYFHIVFTLPQELRSLVMGNRKVLFNLLFEAGHYALNKLSGDTKYLGAKPGIISILHTNGQDLSFHPHIHPVGYVIHRGKLYCKRWRHRYKGRLGKRKKNEWQFFISKASYGKNIQSVFFKTLATINSRKKSAST